MQIFTKHIILNNVHQFVILDVTQLPSLDSCNMNVMTLSFSTFHIICYDAHLRFSMEKIKYNAI